MMPGKQRHPRVERAVISNSVWDVDIVGTTEKEIVLAMSGRNMYKTCSGFCGYEVRWKHWYLVIVFVFVFLSEWITALTQRMDTISVF